MVVIIKKRKKKKKEKSELIKYKNKIIQKILCKIKEVYNDINNKETININYIN